MTGRLAIIAGGLLGASGVGLGAYHAHGLENLLLAWELPAEQLERRLNNAGVAVQFQLIHGVALVAVGTLASGGGSRCLAAAVALFGLGVLLFSGGLFAIAFLGPVLPPAVVPSGGLMLIVAWLALALHAGACWSK